MVFIYLFIAEDVVVIKFSTYSLIAGIRRNLYWLLTILCINLVIIVPWQLMFSPVVTCCVHVNNIIYFCPWVFFILNSFLTYWFIYRKLFLLKHFINFLVVVASQSLFTLDSVAVKLNKGPDFSGLLLRHSWLCLAEFSTLAVLWEESQNQLICLQSCAVKKPK